MIVTSDTGCLAHLNRSLNATFPAGGTGLTVHLYTNDVTPLSDGTDTVSRYTEATGGGYASKALAAGGWAVALVDGIPTATFAVQLWTLTALTGDASVYGYYVLDGDGVFMWAERAAAAITPVSSGTPYAIIPRYQMSAGEPA